jgi:hypothetical protein
MLACPLFLTEMLDPGLNIFIYQKTCGWSFDQNFQKLKSISFEPVSKSKVVSFQFDNYYLEKTLGFEFVLSFVWMPHIH